MNHELLDLTTPIKINDIIIDDTDDTTEIYIVASEPELVERYSQAGYVFKGVKFTVEVMGNNEEEYTSVTFRGKLSKFDPIQILHQKEEDQFISGRNLEKCNIIRR